MQTVLIVIMVIAGIAMLWAMKKYKSGAMWGKPVACICALIGLGCAIGHMVASGPESSENIRNREAAFVKVANEKLGGYLAEKHPGSRTVILHEPGMNTENFRHAATIEGLKNGFGTNVSIISTTTIEIPDAVKDRYKEQMMPEDEGPIEHFIPIEEWLTPELFDELIELNKDANFIISTIGLPMEFRKMKYWRNPDLPKLVFTLGGNVYELKPAIKGNFVIAAVTYNPKAEFDQSMPDRDLEKAFAQRYILVTPENVDEVSQEFPGIFVE